MLRSAARHGKQDSMSEMANSAEDEDRNLASQEQERTKKPGPVCNPLKPL